MLKSGCDRFLPSWGRFLRAPLAVRFATAPTKKGPRKGPRTYSIRKRRPSPAHEGGCCREGVRYPDLGSSSACAFPTLSVASCMPRHPYRSGSVPDFHRLPENTLTIGSSDSSKDPTLTSRARIRQSSTGVNLNPLFPSWKEDVAPLFGKLYLHRITSLKFSFVQGAARIVDKNAGGAVPLWP